MSDINVTMEIQDVISQTARLLNLTEQQRQAWEKTAIAVVKYDKALEKEVTTVKGSIDATRELTATWLNAGTGAAEALSASVRKVSEELIKNKAAAKAAAQAAKDLADEQKKRAQEEAKAERDLVRAAQAKEKAIAAELAAKERAAAAASRLREKQLQEEARLERQINDRAAKEAARANIDARKQVLGQAIPGVNIGGAETQSKLLSISRNIADLGVKAGLTARQLQELFMKVQSGNLAGIDTKYAKVVEAIVRYNDIIQKEIGRLNNLANGGNGPGPSGGNIERAREYLNIIGRIQATLTNLAIYRGFNLLTKQFSDSVTEARNYQTQVGLIRTISQDANLSAGEWTRGIKQVSNTLAVDFKDAATAAYNAVSAQIVQGQATFDYLKETGELARTTGASLTDSGNVVAGVINSYKLSAQDAGDISAKLFRTVDLGNVVLGELSGTIGRVTALGNDLGVNFDEVLATLSTFTRNGVKTADAMTFLNNVFTKLLAPTDKMKAVLKNLGIESAGAAVKTQGFRTVLEQLINEVEKGNVDATDLFPEIRGEKGFALFRQNLKEFDRDLKEIGVNSRQYFENAKNIVSDTDADKINRFMTVFKSVLTTNIGDSLNKFIANMIGVQKSTEDTIQFTERLEKTIQGLIQTVVTGGTVLGTFMAGMRVLGVITELQAVRSLRAAAAQEAETAAKLKNTAATTSLTAAEARYNAVKSGSLAGIATANPLLTLGVLAASAYTGFQAFKATSSDTFGAASEAYNDFSRRVREGEVQKSLDKQLTIVEKMKEEFQDIAKVVGTSVQDALSQNNTRLTEINEKLKETQDRFKNAFVGALDEGKDKLQEINRQINAIDSSLQNQRKRGSEFAESLGRNALGTANRFATPDQQLQLLSNEFTQVQDRIKKLVSAGTPEALAEAEKLYDRLGTLATQFYDKQADMQNEAFQEAIKQRAAMGEVFEGKQIFTYDPTQQLKTNVQLTQLRNQLDAKGNELLAKRRDLLEQQRIAQEQENKAREKRIKDFETFSVTTATGEVKQQFQTNTGKLDVNKVTAEYKRLTDQLEKDIGADFLKRAEARKVFDERGALIAEQVQRVVVGADLAKVQKQLADATTAGSQALEEGKKKLVEYNAAVKQIGADARAQAEGIRILTETAPDAFVEAGRKQLGGVKVPLEVARRTDPNAEATKFNFEQTRGRVVGLIEELKDLEKNKVLVNGLEIIDPKKFEDVLGRLRQLKNETQSKLGVATRDYGLNIDPRTVQIPGTKDTISDLERNQANLDERVSKALDLQNQSTLAIDSSQRQIELLKVKATEVKNVAVEQQNALKGLAGGLTSLTTNSIAELERLNMKAKEVAGTIQGLSQGQFRQDNMVEIAPGVFGWDTPQAKQYGGPLYRAYGGPIGRDNIPLWGAEGEVMVNASASSRFFSQIMSMNNMARVPQYFNSGGVVTNNNGPVTLNINESNNPQTTAREVMRLLQRSKRLGNS